MASDGKKVVEANFLQFIGGMAVQTLVHLGQMSNPMTGERQTDLVNAKYSIDILAILQEKTKGNLTPEENEYLQNILRDLRMQYVAAAGKKADDDPLPSADNQTSDPTEGDVAVP